ncbi:transposase [Mesorhizobium sp. M0051]|uniref:transposase n=1 Tax=Mesorhizobium sp. M0051 TaxID=2956862 RepID=UPI00333D78AC
MRQQIRAIEQEREHKLAAAPAAENDPHAMVRLIARIIGIGVETADMLVHEILSRGLRDRRAVARYAGLTGWPDESGSAAARGGWHAPATPRVRRGMIQLAWRFRASRRTATSPNGCRRARGRPQKPHARR